MTTPRTLPFSQPLGHQLLSLGLAALVTATLLFSLAAQADAQHADVVLSQAGAAQQACAEQAISRRS